ncbi:hypothetical protein ACFZAU_03355 [Streptomyces sp. NPDC008238]
MSKYAAPAALLLLLLTACTAVDFDAVALEGRPEVREAILDATGYGSLGDAVG